MPLLLNRADLRPFVTDSEQIDAMIRGVQDALVASHRELAAEVAAKGSRPAVNAAWVRPGALFVSMTMSAPLRVAGGRAPVCPHARTGRGRRDVGHATSPAVQSPGIRSRDDV